MSSLAVRASEPAMSTQTPARTIIYLGTVASQRFSEENELNGLEIRV